MDPYRTNRLSQSILEVLSDLLQTAVKDPRVGFVTINRVVLNRDHSVAEIFWSLMNDDEEERKASFAGLKKARGFMQSRLGRTLGLRHAPELRFVYDDSVEKSVALDSVLDELAAKGEFESEQERRKRLTLDDLEVPDELIEGIRQAEKIWIVPHFNPDPDAIGSALALAEALRLMDRDVRVMTYPDPAVGVVEMPGFAQADLSTDAEQIFTDEQPDTLLLVDCHRIDRCGPLEDVLDRFEKRFCIDHHLVSGRKSPEAGWVEPRSCSTCTLIYRLIQVLGQGDEECGDAPFGLSLDMATNIYSGLINDTGSFRFSNTLPFTFELGQRLSAMGVDTAEVARKTFNRFRPEGMHLMQKVIAGFEYHADGRVLLLAVTRQMLAETGANVSDTEGFVNLATSVDGVQRVAFLKEIDENIWRVSLRVRGEGDVQQLAARHGGGGHKQAAGCTIEGELAEVTAALAVDLAATLD
jgi:phosphoesterase RecJ-like protein